MTQRLIARKSDNRSIAKKTPHGRTLEHLTVMDPERDRYSYYHATKGWRIRRMRTKTDIELPR